MCKGEDKNGKCYFNKYTKTCSNDKPEGKPACAEITNPMLCKQGCFWNKYTLACSDTKPEGKPACSEDHQPEGVHDELLLQQGDEHVR